MQLSGLVSGFDWKSFVDTIVDLERTPAKKLQAEIDTNSEKADALDGVGTMLTSLNTAITALNTDGVFDARTASTSGTGWAATAASTAAPGSAAFTVTQLATAAKLTSTNDIGNDIASSSDVSGVSLANLGTGTALTAGVFTVNGARVTVDLGSSLADLFTAIGTATAGKVTASYNATDDKITLANTVEVPANTTPIVLGSSTDTSNFLSITRLANNAGTSITSSTKLGAANPTATLANARLKTPISGVDGSGNGSFTINGVAIAYNTGTDTLNSVVNRINAASAGVSAAFDPITDKVSLQNTSTGDLGFSLADTTGTFLSSLGLTSGATLTSGLNAQFSVNGGPTQTSMSNTLTADTHGITGLSLTTTSLGTQTVSVAADTTSVRTKIDAFINSFNSVQSFIDTQSKVTSTNGKVTTSTLSDNREIQSWGPSLRKNIFAAVPGLSSTMSQLSHIGIDFSGTSSLLSIKEPAKLDAALKERPTEVSAMFRQSSTGILSRLNTLLDSFNGGTLGTGGILAKQKTGLTTSNTSLTTQIADIDRRLVQRRSVLEASFIAMERAQSLIKSSQSQIASITPASAYNKS